MLYISFSRPIYHQQFHSPADSYFHLKLLLHLHTYRHMGVSFDLVMVVFFMTTLWRVIFLWWISPIRVHHKLQRNGFIGPPPTFPFGNTREMRKGNSSGSQPFNTSNDIFSTVSPHFARWRKSYGKVFTYWLGTEPFLYIGDPEFLQQMASGVLAKSWGKPSVFKQDRKPMFGSGLLMLENDDWVHHRHVITPAFSHANLKAMMSLLTKSTNNMLDRWSMLIGSSTTEIEVEKELASTAAEIIAKMSFGIDGKDVGEVFEKLKAVQVLLFQSNRLVGIPFSRLMRLKETLEARKIGKEIDNLLLSIITARMASNEPKHDLLGILLANNTVDGKIEKKLSTHELVDECKTFFFAGHETSALALIWTMRLLALHPEWQTYLREEIKEVTGNGPLEHEMLSRLKKMGWVMNEVLRLYSPAPNLQRQTRGDVQVGDKMIPKGTNIWIDVVGMHHDTELWGDDVYDFKPERFRGDLHGGCAHKMGFLPFGFGGRMCIGKNMSNMEYKIALTLILSKFSFSLSPSYSHYPVIMLTLRPAYGMPIIFQPL